MLKIGFILSMIGGILFFILTYLYFIDFYSLWSAVDIEFVLFFYFFLLANGGAIAGALLGFIDKRWQITTYWRVEFEKIGKILCFLAGLSYPIFLIVFYVGIRSLTFEEFFEDFVYMFYISIPGLILFIGGITNIIEWLLNVRKINRNL